MKLFATLLISIVLQLSISNAQTKENLDYSTIFYDSYLNATNYLITNKWMLDTLQKRGVEPFIAISVVFPELLRYNKLKDLIEVSALKTLYIQYGKTYSDFSIGRFQIKPSFAENIEIEWNKLLLKPCELSKIVFDTANTKNNRVMRIQRMDNDYGQLLYLSLFYIILDSKYSSFFNNDINKVLFFATAYNYGFNKDFNKINSHIGTKEFHIDLFKTENTKCYSYSAISLFFYSNLKKYRIK